MNRELTSGIRRCEASESLDERQEVSLIHDSYIRAGVEFAHAFELLVLLRDVLLVHGCQFQIGVKLRQIEVGAKGAGNVALGVPLDGEGLGFVFPIDLVHVENTCEFGLGWVLEYRSLTLVVDRVGSIRLLLDANAKRMLGDESQDRRDALVDGQCPGVENHVIIGRIVQIDTENRGDEALVLLLRCVQDAPGFVFGDVKLLADSGDSHTLRRNNPDVEGFLVVRENYLGTEAEKDSGLCRRKVKQNTFKNLTINPTNT